MHVRMYVCCLSRHGLLPLPFSANKAEWQYAMLQYQPGPNTCPTFHHMHVHLCNMHVMLMVSGHVTPRHTDVCVFVCVCVCVCACVHVCAGQCMHHTVFS